MKPYALAVVALLELLWFAHSFRATFNLDDVRTSGLHTLRQQHSGPGRYAKLGLDYSAHSSGFNLGGYDPYLLKRYAEFVVWTQGGDPNNADAYLRISRYDPLLQMLRWRYVFALEGDEMRVGELNDPFPQLLLVSGYEVVAGRDNIFAAMRDTKFNPRQTVILESEPQIKPAATSAKTGTVRLVESDSDSLTIEASLGSPQILLITDAYSRHWRAVALPKSSQQSYELLPANYALRAVPLAAGKHRLRVEYAPAAFRIGRAVSIVALLLFAVAGVWCVKEWIRERNSGAHAGSTE